MKKVFFLLILGSGMLAASSGCNYSPEGQAQADVQKSITTLQTPDLSQAEQAVINQMGGYESLMKLLQSAQKADDLTLLTYDEYAAQGDHLPISSSDPAMSVTINNGIYLEFTDNNGVKDTIAIGQDNLPFMWQSGAAGGMRGEITLGTPTPLPSSGQGITIGPKSATTKD